ncbi:50S ribosomal protein L11 [Patescibacteria group bacterium]|uniref:Large ribosomal subunit protein uL11 n=1 Tax=candidate division WWE3 bacterium TaxID=2053526 RepID=A0A928Y501_UNCKA|nr:50S ribosomal protein L11 [candidate division WWE3 bacterium]MCL4732375.1 50S ribosomal protein L11 [Patescibacteria group bacterium]MDL1952800.1 50S ribosomal protein L11 [Candidatus Uhrbacteria bacterium UHB]RIL01036.1 MAG: 50S ribosomal protein L11 [Candidatus Uhrbacteria bacterium]
MAKKVKTLVKLQIKGGEATPAPPVGTALGPHGIQIAEFCKQFNDRTKDRRGEVVPALMTIYEDRSFDFILKTAPVPEMLKKAAGIQKGSGKPLAEKVGTVTKAQIREIAEKKMPDLNCHTIESAMSQVEGTARQMGLTVV